MKKILLTTLALVTALITNNSIEANSPSSGFYVSAIGGAYASIVDKSDSIDIPNVEFEEGTIENIEFDSCKFYFSNGFIAGGALGYKFRNIPFRMEGEFTYRNNRINYFEPEDEDVEFKKLRIDTSQSTYACMGNLFYELNLGLNFTPYIGVGAGYVQTVHKVELEKFDLSICNDSFAAQAALGLSCAISCKTEAALEYRYLYTHNDPHLQNHGVALNLRRFF